MSKRLPRTEIPANHACRLCDFQGKNTQSYLSHAAAKHGLKYELKEDPTGRMQKWREQRALMDPDAFKLKPWHMVALAKHVVYGDSLSAIAKAQGRSPESLRLAKNCPAGQAYIEQVTQQVSDPKFLVQNLFDAASIKITDDWFQAFRWATEARDYDAVHRMAKDIGLKRVFEQDTRDDIPTQITINLGSADLAAAQAETTGYIAAEVLEDENGLDED